MPTSDLMFDFPEVPDLRAELLTLLHQIPPGTVTTFGRLAEALGDSRAARWIGTLLRHDPSRDEWPWHRVVSHNGRLPLTAGVPSQQQVERLQAEGLVVENQKVTVLEYFNDFSGTAPLKTLREKQEGIARQIKLTDCPIPSTVAGIDIAYPQSNRAQAAYVEWSVKNREVVYRNIVATGVSFPYISGHLAFRELPVYRDLFSAILRERELADVILVDGSGLLHPRYCGIAVHLGVILARPTIGVSKKLLKGTIRESSDEEQLCRPIDLPPYSPAGFALRNRSFNQPVFVSPGHLCAVESAREIVNACWKDHRLPEPTYLADKLCGVNKTARPE